MALQSPPVVIPCCELVTNLAIHDCEVMVSAQLIEALLKNRSVDPAVGQSPLAPYQIYFSISLAQFGSGYFSTILSTIFGGTARGVLRSGLSSHPVTIEPRILPSLINSLSHI